MSQWLLSLAAAIVRGWTWLYTLPLDGTTRHARRTEIASDLWEFQHDPARADVIESAVHVVVRGMLGMPDDLLWCCEQLPNHPRSVRPIAVVRLIVAIVAASGLVVSASRPPIDVTRILRVNVASTGWLTMASRDAGALLVPSFAFTLTNTGDQPTSALQVNALFYIRGTHDGGLGTAFSPLVGGRGLAAGATSHAVVLRGLGWRVPADPHAERHGLIPAFALPHGRVKLFVQHQGRWTLLADRSIFPQSLQP